MRPGHRRASPQEGRRFRLISSCVLSLLLGLIERRDMSLATPASAASSPSHVRAGLASIEVLLACCAPVAHLNGIWRSEVEPLALALPCLPRSSTVHRRRRSNWARRDTAVAAQCWVTTSRSGLVGCWPRQRTIGTGRSSMLVATRCVSWRSRAGPGRAKSA